MIGLPREIDVDSFMVQSEDHGGSKEKTIKKLILEDTFHIRQNGREYKNPVRKVQRSKEEEG